MTCSAYPWQFLSDSVRVTACFSVLNCNVMLSLPPSHRMLAKSQRKSASCGRFGHAGSFPPALSCQKHLLEALQTSAEPFGAVWHRAAPLRQTLGLCCCDQRGQSQGERQFGGAVHLLHTRFLQGRCDPHQGLHPWL